MNKHKKWMLTLIEITFFVCSARPFEGLTGWLIFAGFQAAGWITLAVDVAITLRKKPPVG